MLRWNSNFSVAVDLLFGMLPALPLTFYAFLGCVLTLPSVARLDSDLLKGDVFLVLGVSLFGLLSCTSLMAVAITRGKTKFRQLHIFFLGLGFFLLITLATIVPIYTRSFDLVIPIILLFGIPMAFIALKFIYLLSRASEVQP
jgi:hypothetical protein